MSDKRIDAISVDRTLKYIAPLLEELDKRVKASLADGKSLPVTTLARELAPVYGIEWNEVYNLINVYVAAHADLIRVKRGMHGGLTWVEGT